MTNDGYAFFRELIETPSPSGYEQPIQAVVRDYCHRFTPNVRTDVHGNVMAAFNPDAPRRVMLAGHCDQIGLVVTHIDEHGFLYTLPIGGWDPQQLIGQRMTVWTREGPVAAVIARKPIHLLSEEERRKVVKLEELWLDIGARDQAEAAETVRIGDPVTLELQCRELRNGLVSGPGMDNATGLWVVLETLRRLAEKPLRCAVFAVSTVQEEIGLRGAHTSAFGLDPQLAIAVDVNHATDCPTIKKHQLGEVRLGGGPMIARGPNVNPRVFDQLIATAEQAQIPYQIAAHNRGTGTDANALQLNRAGVATGLVKIPNRYMHSPVETVALADLERAAELLTAWIAGLTGEEDYTP